METSCKNLVKENQDWKIDQVQQSAIMQDINDEPLQVTELPDSIFLHIFNYLPFTDIGSVAQVCQRWWQISSDELLWRGIFFRQYRLPVDTKMPAKAHSWRSEFKRLHYHTPCLLSEERKEHRDEVLHISFSHDGTMFATCSKDGFFKIWQCGQECRLLFEKDMMSSFSWKFTQFSQFNETDTCLLVSGVYFGSYSTSGEIAIFDLLDDFKMQCRVTNKPYDVFGAWYDNDHLLSGTLYWTGDFNSVSAVWLSKASQEVESEMESVSMVLYRFENRNSSSIRLIHVAEVERHDNSNNEWEKTIMENSPILPGVVDCQEKAATASAMVSDICPCAESGLGIPRTLSGKNPEQFLDNLLKKSIAENEFDVENEDATDDDDEMEGKDVKKGYKNGQRVPNFDISDSQRPHLHMHDANFSHQPPKNSGMFLNGINFNNELDSGFGDYSCRSFLGTHEYCDENDLVYHHNEFESEEGNDNYSIFSELTHSSDLELQALNLNWNVHSASNSSEGDGSPSQECVESHKSPKCRKGGRSKSTRKLHSQAVFNSSNICNDFLQQSNNNASFVSDKEIFRGENLNKRKSLQHDRDNGSKIMNYSKTIVNSKGVKCYNQYSQSSLKSECDEHLKLSGSSSQNDFVEDSSVLDTINITESLSPPCDTSPNTSSSSCDHQGTVSSNNKLSHDVVDDAVMEDANSYSESHSHKLTDDAATQTDGGASLASSLCSTAQMSHSMSHSSSLSREATRSSTEKLLIYTWGSETYIPHKIGIKRIKRSDFCKGEVKARQSSMLLPDVMENLQNMSEDRRNVPDVSIDMHGHIVGLSLSPDQRYLYVNCRAWPRNYFISDPQESPPLAQEVEISTIDLTTFQFVGPVLRSHKAYTHSDECFFLNLDVSSDYVVSGAEDRRGYIWDRHYGICLGHFDHRSVVNCMAICPSDPEIAVSVSDDHTFKVWMSRCKMKDARKSGKSLTGLTHRNNPVLTL